ncbi:MAG: LamG-like jellyroll fold domain-containing protein, partial [Planctomycetota bacterium]
MKNANTIVTTLVLMNVWALCVTASAGWSEAVPVNEVNTGNQEGWPVLSFDGLTLYFGRRVSDVMKIYEATRSVPSGPFSGVREVLRASVHVVPAWISPDNLRMYYHEERGSGWLIKVSQRMSVRDSWPQGTNVSELSVLGHIGDHSLTSDELTIVFCGNQLPGNLDRYDLWTASRIKRSLPFGNIRHLSEVNSASMDSDPYLTPDGLTLYFSSRRTGTGQIFRANRSSITEPFASPEVVLVPGVAAAEQPTLSSDGKTLYFSNNDIYVSYLEEEDDGLVGHWKFDEGEGSIAYDSAGDNDGIILSGAWTDGVLGGALDFDGVNSGVALPDNWPVWLPEYDFTCSLWVCFNIPPTISRHETLLDLNATSSSDPINDIGCAVKRIDTGEASFGFNTFEGVTHVLYSDAVLDQGRWYHVVALRNATTQAMYIDGSLECSGACADGQIDYDGGSYDDDGVSIGRATTTNSPNGAQQVNAKMDDVRIYNRALSPGEVEQLYGQGADDGLVGHWKFDEGGGSIAYDSAGDNDGVVYGATWADGILDGALDFDGADDYVDVADDPSMRVNQYSSFSVSAWVKPVSDGYLLSKMRANERRGVFEYSLFWSGSFEFGFVVDRSWSVATAPLLSSAVSRGNWHHVTIVYDNKDKKIYVNGALHNSGVFDRDTGDTEPDKHFVIGARSWDYTIERHFGGSIDDVRYYDRALSAAEVEELYGFPPDTGLVGHWKFDEGDGLIAYDSAGNNDG